MFIKLRKLFAILFAIISTISYAQAQELINLVPNESIFAGMADLSQIDAKANIADLLKLQLFEKLNLKIGEQLFGDSASTSYLDLKKYGISTQDKSWAYVKISGEVYYGALLFKLDDASKFEAFVQKVINQSTGSEIKNAGSYKYLNKKKLNIAWNSKTLAIYGASLLQMVKDSIRNSLEPKISENYYDDFVADSIQVAIDQAQNDENQTEIVEEPANTDDQSGIVDLGITNNDSVLDTIPGNTDYLFHNDYSSNDYMDIYNKTNEKSDSIEQFWCETNASIFLQPQGMKSIANNKTFMDYIKSNPDAAGILDYNQLFAMQNSIESRRYAYGMDWTNQYLSEIYKGMCIMGKASFNKDDIQLQFDAVHSEKMKTLYKDVKKTKISNKFLKYLNNDLMGYAAVGVDIKGMSKGLGQVLREIYPTIPEYGDIASAAMDVVDIFIDEDAIYNILSGDVVVALNGIKPVENIHTVYDYDDNYNMKERLDTTMEMQPEVLFMAGIGNVQDVNKFLKLFMATKVLEQEGNIYSVGKGASKLPVFIAIHDDILFISNNRSFVEQPKIYAKNEQLSKEHVKMFSKNTGVMFANTEKIAKQYALQGLSKNEKILENAGDLFKSVTITGGYKDGISTSGCVLKLSNTSNNSLTDIFKFLNDLYLFKTTRFD
jgi:hypothetical protein